ncbi:diphosphomevalonate decarboxylase-like [Clavelina lepadiformis]|uniref:diphosphomevalonate decarboxylase-like n=1 Tax=Clavelina lepadiformis TaxID=159417 RepID=UPI004041D069
MDYLKLDESDMVTFSAPVNIAIIKYWGKSCQKLNLPMNSSLSLTLNQDHLQAKTTIATSSTFIKDRIWLNGKEQDVEGNTRLQACLKEIRRLARLQAVKRNEDVHRVTRCSQKVHISSRNNFPTAAGLASSAAGYAVLVAALGQLYRVDCDLSGVARCGSGSACRSMLGGFVEWVKGGKSDGTDSIAQQFVGEEHWPELRVLIVVTSAQTKAVGSTEGMQRSVETSALLQHRVDNVVPDRMKALTDAILNKDFSAFAEICMKESNQLHAVCQDTFPPLRYLNNVSEQIIRFVHAYNEHCSDTRVAYTFDAGPNAFLFVLERHLSEVASLIYKIFGPATDNATDFFRGERFKAYQSDLPDFETKICPTSAEYVICTKAGPGPLQLFEHNISPKTGLPLP